MRKLCVLLLSIGFLSANAQTKVDSLIRVLPDAPSDTVRVKILNGISSRHDNPELKYNYALKALALSKKIKWDKGIAASLYNRAEALYVRGEYLKAALAYKDAGEKYKALGNLKKAVNCLVNVGSCYIGVSNYPKASENYFAAAKVAEESQNLAVQGIAYEGIATVFSRESNLDKSISYGLKALKINRKLKNNLRIASVSHLLGVSYHLKDDTKNAGFYYRESLKNYTTIGDSLGMATNYSHLGIIEKKTDFNKGLGYQLQSYAIFERTMPDFFNSIQNMGNLGNSYLEIYQSDKLSALTKISKRQALDKASAFLDEGLRRSRKTEDVQNTVEMLRTFAEVAFAKGNYGASFEAMKEYQTLHDSLFSQDNKNKIASLESAQQMALKDKEIQLSKLAIDARERQKWYLFAGIGCLLVIGSLLFIQSRNRQKTNAKLNKLNAELKEANNIKTRFFSILNHDLRGPAASVVNFLRLQETPEMIDEKKREGYRLETINSAEYLLDTMEDLLLWCKGQMENFTPVATEVAVGSLFESIRKHFPNQDNVAFVFNDPQNLIISTDEDYLVTIMRNLTGNAIKSKPAGANLRIEWNAWRENGKEYLSITDNGMGGTSEKFRALYDDTVIAGTRSGLGLHLIRDLAQAINCSIKLDSEAGKGTEFTLSFNA